MKIKIKELEGKKYNLNIRETIDGRIFITDHPDVDIVISPKDKKVITFPKENVREEVYGTQDLFFKFLVKKGVILPESIQGGSVYFSIEGTLPESSKEINIFDLLIYNIAEFIEQEEKYFQAEQDYKEIVDKRMHSPDEEESTELGKVPQGEKKGSIPRGAWPFHYGGSLGVTY